LVLNIGDPPRRFRGAKMVIRASRKIYQGGRKTSDDANNSIQEYLQLSTELHLRISVKLFLQGSPRIAKKRE
jgi:hypothetical protein